jgi:hypothetical protein
LLQKLGMGPAGGAANWALILGLLAGRNYIFCRVHWTNLKRNSISQWACKQLLLQWIRTRCHRLHLNNSSRLQLAGRAALVPFITRAGIGCVVLV